MIYKYLIFTQNLIFFKGFTENPVKKDEKDFIVTGDGKNMDIVPPSTHDREKEHPTSSERDSNKRHHHHNHHEISDTAGKISYIHYITEIILYYMILTKKL